VDISDHRPILIGLNLPGVVRGAKAKKSKTARFSSSPDIDAKDPEARTVYQGALNPRIPDFDLNPTPEVAEGQLLQISSISAEAARLGTPPTHPKRSSF